jgi:hypothetical protein
LLIVRPSSCVRRVLEVTGTAEQLGLES